MTELKGWWMLMVSLTAGLPATVEWWIHGVAAMITVALVALVYLEEIEKPPRYIVVLPTFKERRNDD